MSVIFLGNLTGGQQAEDEAEEEERLKKDAEKRAE